MAHSSVDIPNFVGIDFGTSRCAVTRIDRETGKPVIIKSFEDEEHVPSVVYYGDHEVLVGRPAADIMQEGDAADRARVVLSIKRLIARDVEIPVGSRRVTPLDVATDIFRKLRRDAEEGYFHDSPPTHAVVTVPATFTPTERDRITEAARGAGFEEIALLEEPVAAAIAYAAEGFEVSRHLLVYDLGAGTFDLALLARNQDAESFRLAMEPDGRRVGGDDFDEALYDYCDAMVAEQLGRRVSLGQGRDLRFLAACRKRKVDLSSRERCTFSSLLDAEEGGKPVTFKCSLTRAAFEDLVRPTVDDTVRQTAAFFRRACEQKCEPDTVVLIGGSSKIPLIKLALAKSLPIEPHYWDQGALAVALGAAYHANALWGIVKSPEERAADAISLARERAAGTDYRAALEALAAAEALHASEEEVHAARAEVEQEAKKAYAARVRELLDGGLITEAETALAELSAIAPDAAASRSLKGLIAELKTARKTQADFASAKDAFNRGDPEAALKLLTKVWRQGRYVDKDAVAQLRKDVNAALRRAKLLRILQESRACSEHGEHEAAWQKLEEASELAPGAPEVAEARSALEESTIGALLSAGFGATEARDYSQARAHLDLLLKLCPTTAPSPEVDVLKDAIDKGEAVDRALKAARRKLKAGKAQAAMDDLQTLLREYPGAVDAAPVAEVLATAEAEIARARLSALISEASDLIKRADYRGAWETARRIRSECAGDEATAAVEEVRESIVSASCRRAEDLMVGGDVPGALGTLAELLGVCPEAAESPRLGAVQAIIQGALEAEEPLAQAKEALDAGDWGAVHQAATRALALYPRCVKAFWYQGLAAAGRGNHESALRCLDQALSLLPEHVEALRAKAQALIQLGRLDEALPVVEQLIARHGADAELWSLKGQVLRMLGRPREAVTALDTALRLSPSVVETWLWRAACCEDGGALKSALATYDRALQVAPDNVDALLGKGRALVGLDRPEEALPCFDRASTLDPRSPRALVARAEALLALGRAPEALAASESAARLDTSAPEVFAVQAEALLSLGRAADALNASDRALGLDPSNVAALVGRASALLGLSRAQEALEAAERAVATAPTSADAWEAKALALRKTGARPGKQLECWTEVVRLDRRRPEAWKTVGWLLISISEGQTEERANANLGKAQKAFGRATALAPDDVEAWFGAGSATRLLGQYAEALQQFERALGLQPQEPAVLNAKGLCLHELGRAQEALQCYDKALSRDRSQWEVQQNRGFALLALSRHEDALRSFEAALRGDPRSADAWMGKGIALQKLGRGQKADAAFRRAAQLEPAYAFMAAGNGAPCPRCKSTNTVRETAGLGRKAMGVVAGGVAGVVAAGVIGAITGGAFAVAGGHLAAIGTYRTFAATGWRCRSCGNTFKA